MLFRSGKDFDTEDGTCIRDFIHVQDVAELHLRFAKLLEGGRILPPAINLGSGIGLSVLQVVERIMQRTGLVTDIEFQPARFGDPAEVVGDVELLTNTIGKIEMRSLDEMIDSVIEY